MAARTIGEQALVILTGAGISAESGLDTFRDPDGIWSRYDMRDVATPDGFLRNPALVHDFYNLRRRESAAGQPNPAHRALARLEAAWTGPFLLVTQNIDGLHEAGGSAKVLHMHGRLDSGLCLDCDGRFPLDGDTATDSACPHCGARGTVRPDIVWFGEVPYEMDRIYHALGEAEIFISIGTSGTVYPAANFVREARLAGAYTVEINLEASANGRGAFDEVIEGRASLAVPAFVETVLSGRHRVI